MSALRLNHTPEQAYPLLRLASQSEGRFGFGNDNHHLWNNNGTWFIHYTVYPTPVTKQRIRRSLGTRDLAIARARRDSILADAG